MNFYIVATSPNKPSLRVNISGPYLTQQAAHADMSTVIGEAMGIDPNAQQFNYSVASIESRRPGIIQHMARHA